MISNPRNLVRRRENPSHAECAPARSLARLYSACSASYGSIKRGEKFQGFPPSVHTYTHARVYIREAKISQATANANEASERARWRLSLSVAQGRSIDH